MFEFSSEVVNFIKEKKRKHDDDKVCARVGWQEHDWHWELEATLVKSLLYYQH